MWDVEQAAFTEASGNAEEDSGNGSKGIGEGENAGSETKPMSRLTGIGSTVTGGNPFARSPLTSTHLPLALDYQGVELDIAHKECGL